MAEEQDAAAREEHARRELERPPRAVTSRGLAGTRARSLLWGEELAVAWVALLLAVLTVAVLYRGQEVGRTGSGSGGGDIVAVGDSASGAAITELSPMRTEDRPAAVGLPMPEKPFSGQRTPP